MKRLYLAILLITLVVSVAHFIQKYSDSIQPLQAQTGGYRYRERTIDFGGGESDTAVLVGPKIGLGDTVFQRHDGKELIRIKSDGQVIISKDYTMNEATRVFWDAFIATASEKCKK